MYNTYYSTDPNPLTNLLITTRNISKTVDFLSVIMHIGILVCIFISEVDISFVRRLLL